jgi:hypothetical protein
METSCSSEKSADFQRKTRYSPVLLFRIWPRNRFSMVFLSTQANAAIILRVGHDLFVNCLSNLPFVCLPTESESESYVTADGQSASLSWYKAPIRGLRPDFYFRTEYGICLTVTFLIPWGALSDERTGLSFVRAAGLASAVFLGS